MDYHDIAGKMRMPPWMSDSSVAPSEPVIEEMARSMLGVDALPQDLKEMLGKLKAYSKKVDHNPSPAAVALVVLFWESTHDVHHR